MKIETTINIDVEMLERIMDVAEHTGVSVRSLISAMLRAYMEGSRIKHSAFTRVCYQERRDSDRWKRLHLSLMGDEYEYCLDLRKVCKMSVSFLVAYAIEHFLEELIGRHGKNIDSYRYQNYTIMKFKVKNVIGWLIYWGIPPRNPKL